MKTSEALRIGRAKIAAGGLAKDAFARDRRGFAVSSFDERACSFCMIGALPIAECQYVAMGYLDRCVPECFHLQEFGLSPTVRFSDHFANTRAALALYDCAIELAESEGQ